MSTRFVLFGMNISPVQFILLYNDVPANDTKKERSRFCVKITSYLGGNSPLLLPSVWGNMKVYARTPLDLDKISVPRGLVYVIPERCKGCEICIMYCPQDVLQISEQCNAKGYHYPDIVPGRDSACVHCEFCTLVCPEFAIFTLAQDGAPP